MEQNPWANLTPAAPSKIGPMNEGNHVDLLPPSTKSLPVYHDESEGKSESSPKFSIGPKSLSIIAEKLSDLRSTCDLPVVS